MGQPDWRFSAHGRDWSAWEVSALILRKLAADVERTTGEAASRVVVTVPAYFGDEERQATRRAGEIANLQVLDIINEPTAAAYSYGLTNRSAAEAEHVLVYDLGGGTFDVTVLKVEAEALTTVATDGNHQLGGADIDKDLADELGHRIMEDTGSTNSPLDEPEVAQYLLSRAEAAKRQLSGKQSTTVHYVHEGKPGKITLTQQELNDLAANVVEQTLELTSSVLAAAKDRGVDKIDRLLLVGGQSKMPVIAEQLQQRFGLNGELKDPDLAVVRGAALYGYKKQLEQQATKDLVDSGAIAPGQQVIDASDEDLNDVLDAGTASANPAMRLADMRRMLKTQITNVLSRGVGVVAVRDPSRPDDVYAYFLAHRNDPLPLSRESVFYTLVADQPSVQFTVFEQGGNEESESVEDNNTLGEGVIADIPPGYPEGTPIKVLLTMTESGVLELRAQHPGQSVPLQMRLETAEAARDPRAVAEAKKRISGVAVAEETAGS